MSCFSVQFSSVTCQCVQLFPQSHELFIVVIYYPWCPWESVVMPSKAFLVLIIFVFLLFSHLLSFVDLSLLILCFKCIHFYLTLLLFLFLFDYFGFSFLMCNFCLLISDFSYFLLIYASSCINLPLNTAFINPMTLLFGRLVWGNITRILGSSFM